VTLEEGRAQALQQLLLERGLTARLAPPALWQAYQQALAAQNRAGRALEQAGEAEAKAKRALDVQGEQPTGAAAPPHQALASAQATRVEAEAAYTRARLAAEARWAAVKQGTPYAFPPLPDPEQARRALPPGTLFTAFSVGEHGSTLFLVRSDGPVEAYRLALGRAVLAERVALVRRTLAGDRGRPGARPGEAAERRAAAGALYQDLFPPAARPTLAAAQRLVLSPDGPLWDLPFAALEGSGFRVQGSGEGSGQWSVLNAQRSTLPVPSTTTRSAGTPQRPTPNAPRYLGLTKPLVYAQSLTLYLQALQPAAAPAAGPPRALVVGNPLFHESRRREFLAGARPGAAATPQRPIEVGARGEGELALLSRAGSIPAQLPGAEAEARAIARLYGTPAAVGVLPTEAWFRRHCPEAAVIHLATHGYLHPLRAMSSGLRLAVAEPAPPPGATENDGALQAWEIMTQLKLQAELVVLSACETGLGEKVRGEGLVGLTRALQYAGARSIVASQWPVSDASTQALMVRFHQELRKGAAKDEALRRAMAAVAADAKWAHPYYWAPFLLVGDPENRRLAPPRPYRAQGTRGHLGE
jgi:CHAT domain-containing protein